MQKTMIATIAKDKNGVEYGKTAAGENLFNPSKLPIKAGDWVTLGESKQTKTRKDKDQPSTPDNLRDKTPEELAATQTNLRILAVFPDVKSMAKALSSAKEADMHVDAYVNSLSAEIAAGYADMFAAA